MEDHSIKQIFLDAAERWVCDGYSLDFRFIAKYVGTEWRVWSAIIALNPLAAIEKYAFLTESNGFVVGHLQHSARSKASLLTLLQNATFGHLEVPDKSLVLFSDHPLNYQSEMSRRDRPFSELHLQISSTSIPTASPADMIKFDNALRNSNPPFDGITDVLSWLGLPIPDNSSSAQITLKVGPPVDLITDQCSLVNNKLCLVLHAHPEFDIQKVGLAVRAVPGLGLSTRIQAADHIKWKNVQNDRREASAEITLENADNMLAMLTVGSATIRRHWFIDSTKARNNRYQTVQHFDQDLRMIRNAVLESNESQRFENGVAALAFLLGFNPAVQIETNSPDLIVTTPGGQLVIVECTLRTSDFAQKVGKLVDRRGSLIKSLQVGGHAAVVTAILICRQPIDQIVFDAKELKANKVILLTSDDLTRAFERARFPNDPDKVLEEANSQF